MLGGEQGLHSGRNAAHLSIFGNGDGYTHYCVLLGGDGPGNAGGFQAAIWMLRKRAADE